MAINFRPLPVDAFPVQARPSIKHLNVVLRDLCGLEGTIRQPVTARRSDQTVARKSTFQVDVSRITPSITEVVSGSSTVVGTPSLTLDTVNVVGSTTTAVSINSTIAAFDTTAASVLGSTAATGSAGKAARRDHQHIYPQALLATANASTLTLTDTPTTQSLDGSLGDLSISAYNDGGLFFGNGVSTLSGAVASVQLRPSKSSNTFGLQTQYLAAGISSHTIACWNVNLVHGASMNGSTIIGFNTQVMSISPASGSDSANSVYGGIISGPLINNNTGGFQEVAAIKMGGPRRLASNPTVTAAYGAIIECPTVSGNTQAAIHIRQRTAQATAAVRAGIAIDAQNSGTVRYSILGISDLAKFTGTLCCDGAFGSTGNATFGNSITIAGNIDHNGSAVGLYGATPTVQHGTTGTVNGFAAGTSTAVTVDSTFTGNTGSLAYTIGDVVRALKLIGVLAY